MLKNKFSFAVTCALIAMGSGSALAQDWKDVAQKQMELQMLLLQKDMAEAEAKIKEAKDPKPTDQTGLMNPSSRNGPSIEPNFLPGAGFPGGLPGALPGLSPDGMPAEADATPHPNTEKMKLVAIYGADSKNLLADFLYDEEVVTVSKDPSRGVTSFYGWSLISLDTKSVVLTKKHTEKAGKKEKQIDVERVFVLRRAAMAPMVGAGAGGGFVAPSAPPMLNDSTSRAAMGGRFGIPRAPQVQPVNQGQPPVGGAPVPNANSFQPGQPLPSSILAPTNNAPR